MLGSPPLIHIHGVVVVVVVQASSLVIVKLRLIPIIIIDVFVEVLTIDRLFLVALMIILFTSCHV